MKTKNAPKDLKCKINKTFFLETGVPKRGGVRHLGKIPKKSRFFWGWRPLAEYNYAAMVHTTLCCHGVLLVLHNMAQI